MNPADGDWWWRYGLDGVVGGVFTALVAGVAVWLTLRHERRLARQEGLITVVAQLSGLAFSLATDLSALRVGSRVTPEAVDRTTQTSRQVQLLGVEVWARAQRDWPGFASKIQDAREKLLTAMAIPSGTPADAELLGPSIDSLHELGALCLTWMSDDRKTRAIFK